MTTNRDFSETINENAKKKFQFNFVLLQKGSQSVMWWDLDLH